MTIDRRILAAVSGGVMAVVCLFFILSNGLPSWGNATILATDTTVGLWQTCTKSVNMWLCIRYDCPSMIDGSICSRLKAARAFITTACIISAIAALSLIACIFQRISSNKMIVLLAQCFTLASLIVGVIGIGVGIGYVTRSISFYIGAAAILGIIAVIMNLISVILAFMIR